jgi:glycosyltransferase involved in cell wall biosynthesis
VIKVQILLSTFNGEKYLKEQIESLLYQTGINVSILVRDDGSTDNTTLILEEYKQNGKLDYFVGTNTGYGKSFLKLASICQGADYYAFCDQDDVWCDDKLISAIEKLEQYQEDMPNLYFSNLKYVDENLDFLSIKDFSNMKVSLYSSFMRHRAAGCTMVFNDKLLQLVKRYNFENYDNIIHHDAWVYRLCLCVGGNIYFDKESYIKYRQHGSNVTGIKQGIKKRFDREIKKFITNKDSKLMIAKIVVENYAEDLPRKNMKLVMGIVNYKDSYKTTISLLKDKEFRSGNFLVDLLTFLEIIFRCF